MSVEQKDKRIQNVRKIIVERITVKVEISINSMNVKEDIL